MENLFKNLKDNNTNSIEIFFKKPVTKMFSDVYEDVVKTYYLLKEKNIEKGDWIGICSDNCYEFVLIDLACMIGGFHIIPFHKTQFNNNYIDFINEFNLKLFFTDLNTTENPEVINLYDFTKDLVKLEKKALDFDEAENISLEKEFTSISTSGTTGNSKYFNVTFKSAKFLIVDCLMKYNISKNDKFLSFLPFSQFSSRCYVFAALFLKFDLVLTDLKNLIVALKKSKPSILQGVPVFFNNLYDIFLSQIQKSFSNKLTYFFFLFVKNILTGKDKIKLQKRLFKDIHSFWGGNMRILLTGAAPSRKEVLTFYDNVGLTIYEVYGLVETGLISMNYPGMLKIGSVGRVLDDKEIKFDEDNQLYVKSEYCWAKKYINCSEVENKQTFHDDGYIATGDSAYVDKDNFLFLTGRLKDIIILSNGNNIHPVKIENSLNTSPCIYQSVVFGNNKPYLVAVVVKNTKDISDKQIRSEIKKINRKSGGKYQIKYFILTDIKFDKKNKLLNENMKLNRKNIYKYFQNKIEDLYNL